MVTVNCSLYGFPDLLDCGSHCYPLQMWCTSLLESQNMVLQFLPFKLDNLSFVKDQGNGCNSSSFLSNILSPFICHLLSSLNSHLMVLNKPLLSLDFQP